MVSMNCRARFERIPVIDRDVAFTPVQPHVEMLILASNQISFECF